MLPVVLLFAFVAAASAQTPSDLDFTGAIGELRDLPQQTTKALIEQAEETLARRSVPRNEAEVKARAARVREQILRNIGGLPEKTPLNARVVGVIDRGAYRIEKIIFESLPKFYVTASLYIPSGSDGPFPGILFPLGHEPGAKAHEAWQIALGSFATKGFVALAWDPAGQGERSQFWDPDLRAPKLRASTSEHTALGIQALISGQNMARYHIHDAIRALDYLVSRKEVDPNRIAVTGNSGGGMMTAYVAAIDDRIKVAMPSCYITSWKTLIRQLGPQDAEQNLPPWISQGFDFPDFIYAAGLKPYLMLVAIRDFFPVGGARATAEEVRGVYAAAGVAEKFSIVEADDGHGYTKPRRLAAYAWLSRWLKGGKDDGTEPDIKLATEEELFCTPTGQVATSLGGETVHGLIQKSAAGPAAPAAADVLKAVRKLTAFSPPSSSPAVTGYGVLQRQGYRIEKFVYESEPGIRIPALLAVPAKFTSGTAAVLVNCAGKSAAGPKIAALAQAGTVVLAADIRGCGELTIRDPRQNDSFSVDPFQADYRNTTAALLLGQTMAGLRARDIAGAVKVLRSRRDLNITSIRGIGSGAAAVPMLYAAALEPEIASLELEALLRSYRSAIDSRFHRRVYEHVLPGVLQHFDIPDLIRAVGPRPVSVLSYVDAMGHVTNGAGAVSGAADRPGH